MDLFNECIIKRKIKPVQWLYILGIIIATIALIFVVFSFGRTFTTVMPFLIVPILYIAYQIILRFSVEYEYSMTTGELDIDKIIAERRRKRIVTFLAKNITYFAPLTPSHEAAFNDASIVKKIDVTSGMHPDRVYFAIGNVEGIKTRIAFEPTKKMIAQIKNYATSNNFYEA